MSCVCCWSIRRPAGSGEDGGDVAHASTVRGAGGRHGATALTRVATRVRRLGVGGQRGGHLVAALVVLGPPAKARPAIGSATTAGLRCRDTATARTSTGIRAVTNVSMEIQVLDMNIKTCPVSRTNFRYRGTYAILHKVYLPNIIVIIILLLA